MLLALVVGTNFVGCATSEKKETSEPSDAPVIEAPKPSPSAKRNARAQEKPRPTVALVAEPPRSESDAKYRALSQALRTTPGSVDLVATAVQEEATKILVQNPQDPVALNALAMMHLRRGQTGAAKILIIRALDKNSGPESAALKNNLGVILLEEGDAEAALVEFKKAVQLNDRHPEAAGNLGAMYLQAGSIAKAKILLETAHRGRPGDSSSGNNYAIALRASGDLAGAEKIYADLIKANSRDVNAMLNYAILLVDYMNRPKDGMDLVYKIRFIETERKDVLARANALEMKAKSALK